MGVSGKLRSFTRWLRNKVFGELREITIAQSVLVDLSAMARSAHPKEMIAFLSSSRGGIIDGRLHLDELQLQAYDASEDAASVQLWNLPTVTGIMGTVHSHPGGDGRPSDADLHLFSKYGLVHGILPEPYRPGMVRFYGKNGRSIRVRIIG
jgi:proteasome lid subunit RPN8/RPN11